MPHRDTRMTREQRRRHDDPRVHSHGAVGRGIQSMVGEVSRCAQETGGIRALARARCHDPLDADHSRCRRGPARRRDQRRASQDAVHPRATPHHRQGAPCLADRDDAKPTSSDRRARGPVRHRRERDHVAESPAMSTMVGALRSTACRRADQDREAHGTAAGTMGRCRPCPISRTSTAG